MAPEVTHTHETLHLGRDFELVPRIFELRRGRRVLKLERVPMEILLLLVRERARVVGRQEIAEAVWGKDTALDTDNSINGAIRKIRQVLKDDPEQPRFIQTVTGRGYRFIAPVTAGEPVNGNQGAPAEVAAATGVAELPEAPSAPEPPEPAAILAAESGGLPEPGTRRPRRRLLFPAIAAAVLIAVAGGLLWWRHAARPAPAPGTIRLAVLPFRNLTGDPSQEYFSDGFTEEMINQMGGLDPEHLAVIARTSVMAYKNKDTPLRRIAQDLGVQYVLEGSVRRDADRVRITAQLIQTRDQTHVWAHEFDRSAEATLAIQAEIAREIADGIQLALNRRTAQRTAERAELSPQEYAAWDAYLKGRYLWRLRSEQGLRDSVSWFREAIAKDPQYARAYAGLADSWAILSSYGYVRSDIYMPQARDAALHALELDQSSAEAHTSLALVAQNYEWDWQTAEREYRRAIQLNGNYATAHHWFAECLAYEGRFDEALAESERARQLDPLSTTIAADNGAIYFYARQYDRAVARFQSVLDVDPANGRAHLIIDALVQQGRYPEALQLTQNWQAADSPWVWAKRAYIYGRSGDMAHARQMFAKIEKANRGAELDPAALLATAYAGLGDREKWLAVLADAVHRRSNLPTTFKVDPMFDPLRGDARFVAMLRAAGFQS